MADGDLLIPVVSEDAQHQSFKNLILEPRHAPARDLLRDVWAAFWRATKISARRRGTCIRVSRASSPRPFD